MDGNRFDETARLLAGGAGRRRVLRALLGGAVAASLARLRPASGLAQEAPCTKDDDCAAGLICCDGGICCATGGPVPAPTAPPPTPGCQSDADCLADADPCTRARCQEGTCAVSSVLCAAGSVCCGDGQCCPLPCLSDADCATGGGDACTVARCQEGSCVNSQIDCGSDACCGGVCLEPCETGQTYDAACRCVWLDAARPWRRFLRD